MSDHWGTPEWIMSIFQDWHDPCPAFSKGDLLTGVWNHPKVFVNPPYSAPTPWVDKAIRTAKQGSTVVMLLKHDSSTQWYRRLKEAGARFLMIEGRITFVDLEFGTHHRPCSFPSVLAVLS